MLILIQHLRRTAIAAFAALVCSGALNAPEASAASATWNLSSGSTWISTANWNVSGTYPGALGSTTNTDTAVIATTAITGNGLGLNLNTPSNKTFSVGGVLWNYTTASGSIGNNSTAASGTLRLNGGSFNVGSTGGTINNLFFAIGDSATKDLTVSNTAAGGTQSMTVLLNNTSSTRYVTSGRLLSVNVPLIEPAGTPTGFTKVGSGTLTLNAANTFSGTVTVDAGSLSLKNSTALGTGSLSLSASAALVSIDSANINISRPVSITGGGGGSTGKGLIHFTPSTGSGTWSGNVTVNGIPTAGGVFGSGGGELIVSGNVTSASQNVTIRSGTVTLSGVNSFPQLSIIEGTGKVGSSGALPSASRMEVGNGSAFIATLDTNGFSPSIRVLTSRSSDSA
ncbi:MAG: autotransporter-associated beta strand repeat-containing protein, partial [Planctomycetaceae bacterium]